MKLLAGDHGQVISERLLEIPFNTLFASAVLRAQVQGKIYVDDLMDPDACYIAHPYGMSLLIGNTENEEFNASLREYLLDCHGLRKSTEWLQVYPTSWNDKIGELVDNRVIDRQEWPQGEDKVEAGACPAAPYRSCLVRWRRFNFMFRKPHENRNEEMDGDFLVSRIDSRTYDLIRGSVVPRNFWKSKEDFLSRGIGFVITHDNDFVAASFSAFIERNVLELGVETCERYRGRGFGRVACSALIAYCLANGYEPVWACSNANTASCNLARSMGFEESLSVPYYELL